MWIRDYRGDRPVEVTAQPGAVRDFGEKL